MSATGTATTGGPVGSGPRSLVPGTWDLGWIHGTPPHSASRDPPIQVHEYEERTFVLRQSKDLSFEAPFLYLLLGDQRALLLDTGATSDPRTFPLRTTVDGILAGWTQRYPRPEYSLVVAHSHGHGDHVAGDGQFSGRPNTTIVGREAAAVREFFHLSSDGSEPAEFDLGGRILDVLSIPGHHGASIALYDRRTGLLLTGDTVYPGRLYVNDLPAFRTSLARLVEFARGHPVSAVMGGHIEMSTTPGADYPLGARYQPHEARLPMAPERLEAVRHGADAVQRPGVVRFPDFAIYNLPCTAAMFRSYLRGVGWNLRYRLGWA